jgi:CDP-glycerol glycerophosphotransferase (TagB/SpsB family)
VMQGQWLTFAVARVRHLLVRWTRPVVWVLLRVLSARHHAVIHGWPPLEGNVVELLPGLGRRYPHKVFWLVDGDLTVAHRHTRDHGLDSVEVVPKDSARAVWLALTSEVTFFTHGLFTAVTPPPNRLVVNLWHGDGPKATTHARDISSTVAVTGALMWKQYKAQLFGLREEDVAWTGNPRSDALLRGLSVEQWHRLGFDPLKHLVLWLPTFRVGRNAEGLAWADGTPLSNRSDLRDLQGADRHPGVTLVVKPHPMDRDDYSSMGIRVLTDADLQDAGVALYELLGSSTALISDTSSVWVDYLALERPVAFFLPDAEEIESARGFNVPDLVTILPGPVLGDVRDLQQYLETLARDPADPELLYRAQRERIGGAPLGGVPERLLDWLDDYQMARGRRALFLPDRAR